MYIKWSHTVQEATDCDYYFVLHLGKKLSTGKSRWKSQSWSAFALFTTEMSRSTWMLHYLPEQSCFLFVFSIVIVIPDKNLCKPYFRSPKFEIWVSCCHLPVHILFMHQQSDLKRFEDCLPLMSFPRSCLPVWSRQHFMQLSISSLGILVEKAPDGGSSSTDPWQIWMKVTAEWFEGYIPHLAPRCSCQSR